MTDSLDLYEAIEQARIELTNSFAERLQAAFDREERLRSLCVVLLLAQLTRGADIEQAFTESKVVVDDLVPKETT